MKLYFCSKCGKRLSEVDLEKGDARDKKLHGVYCLDCSIGVTTLDTLPMSDDEAVELVSQQEKKTGSFSRKARTPSSGMMRRVRKGDSKAALRAQQAKANKDSSSRVGVPQQPNMLLWVGGGVAACALLVVLVWMFSGQKEGASTNRGVKKTAKALKGSADADFEEPNTGPSKAGNVEVGPAAGTPEQTKEQRAETARSRLSDKLATMSEGDKDAKLAAIDSYLKEFDGTFAAMQVRQWARNIKFPEQKHVVEAKPATQPGNQTPPTGRQAPPPTPPSGTPFPTGIKRTFDEPGPSYARGTVEETQIGGHQGKALKLRRNKNAMRGDLSAWAYPKGSPQLAQKGLFYMPPNARIRYRYYADDGAMILTRFEKGNGKAMYVNKSPLKKKQWVQVDLPMSAFSGNMTSGFLCSSFTVKVFSKGNVLAYIDDIEVVEGK